MRTGFKVSRKEVMEVNERVREVMGAGLMVAERLGARLAEGGGGYFSLFPLLNSNARCLC